jgi:hypothetical protein
MNPKPFSFENHFTVPSANCVPPTNSLRRLASVPPTDG